MDPLSAVMARCSFIWLLVGFVAGGLMLADETLGGDWRLWLQPSHGHALFVGWFLQFALGIAYWLLPRKRSPERPLGYNVATAYAAVAALNLGLLLRVVAEPAERSGHGGNWTEPVFAASALLQVGAAVVFVAQLWPRVAPRALRTTAGRGTSELATSSLTTSPVDASRTTPGRLEHTMQGGTRVQHKARAKPADHLGTGEVDDQ